MILFQDIFTPIPGMGVELDFAPGPVIAKPLRTPEAIDALVKAGGVAGARHQTSFHR